MDSLVYIKDEMFASCAAPAFQPLIYIFDFTLRTQIEYATFWGDEFECVNLVSLSEGAELKSLLLEAGDTSFQIATYSLQNN